MRAFALLVAIVSLTAVAVPVSVQAHSYSTRTTVDRTLEGEAFDSVSPVCDPDYDNEHTDVFGRGYRDWAAPGHVGVFMPHSTCYVLFDDALFTAVGRFTRIEALLGASGDTALREATITLYADGVTVFTATDSQRNSDGMRNITGTGALITPGYHDLKLTYRTVSPAPEWLNLYVDHLDFTPECVDVLPILDALGVDGLANGVAGWAGRAYSFAATVHDPDGDPVTIQWVRGGSVLASGSSVDLTLPLAPPALVSPADLVLRLIEDVTARCPDVGQIVEDLPIDFTLVDGLLPALLGLAPGVSCIAGQAVPAWTSAPLVAHDCALAATTQPAGVPPGVIASTWLEVDGARVLTATPSGALAYDATLVPDGPHEARVCADATTDKYARVFCSAAVPFLDSDCTDQFPTASVTNDAMPQGLGWAGLPYRFTASATDPDGDVLAFVWPDGSSGSAADLALPATGALAGTLRIVERTSLRCASFPDVPHDVALPALAPVSLPTVLGGLTPGRSCQDGVTEATAFAQDVLARRCAIPISMPGPTPLTVAEERLESDGVVVATAPRGTPSLAYDSSLVADGAHSLAACMTFVGDKYQREACSPARAYLDSDCVNHAPRLSYFEGTGMGNGFSVWKSYNYDLTVHAADPEADPLRATWTWPDGRYHEGTTARRSFSGPMTPTVTLTEDASARCPALALPPVTLTGPSVVTLRDWIPWVSFPRAGQSCIAGHVIFSPNQDVIAGSCTISGGISADQGIANIPQGRFLLDGSVLHTGTGATLATTYDSLAHETGGHALQACFSAPTDVYARVFCAPPYMFVNLGAS